MNKKYDVITIDKDLAVVVDKEVKQDDMIIEIASKIMGVYQYDKLHGTHDICIPEKAFPFNTPEYFRKIVGVITETPMKEFPLAGLPLVVLPEEDEDDNLYIKARENHGLGDTPSGAIFEQGYFEGYKAAQQRGTYTEEDLHKAFNAGRAEKDWSDPAAGDICYEYEDSYSYVQSLQPKRFPVSVELEWEHERDHMLPFSEWLKINPDNTIHPVNVYYQ